MNREQLKRDFINNNFNTTCKIYPLPQDCSPRSYDRIVNNDKNFILMDVPIDMMDFNPFIKIDNILLDNNFSAPKIYNVDKNNGFMLLEDFGNNSFNQILSSLTKSEFYSKEREIYQYAVDLLINLHKIDLEKINLATYDKNLLLKELVIFVDYYLKFIKNVELSTSQIQEFQNIWLEILQKLSNDRFLVLRDYHADNLFFLDDRRSFQKIGIIDFQDAVLGSRSYDLVSILQDARRDVSKDLQEYLINDYIAKTNIGSKQFMIDYQILSLQRNVKILGVFARQAVQYKNKRYLDFIPRVLDYVLISLNENDIFNNFKLFLKW